MYRHVVPRLCRQLRKCHIAPNGNARGYYKRDIPVRCARGFYPWDAFPVPRELSKMMTEMSSLFSPLRGRFVPREGEVVTRTETAEVKYDNRIFEVKIDVQQYEPEHLKVSQAEDRLIVSGKHETKPDEHGYISREFSREIHIPENVDIKSISSRLTEDGYLLIEARIKGEHDVPEREIEINTDAVNSNRKKEN